MKLKNIGIVIGALIALTGLIVGAGGVAVLSTIGTDGKVATGDQSFDTSGAALVTSAADLRRPSEVSDIVGDPRIQLDVQSGKPAFVGVARAQDVDRYLKNAPVDEVTDFDVDPFKMEHHPRAGTKRLAPPGNQTFWIAQSSGTNPSLDWKAGSDEYRVVVMNADGSRGVQTHGAASVTIPHTAAIAWSLVGGGLLLLLAGAATIAAAGASDPSPRRTPAYTPAA
jgi:hypothetical protein